MRNKRKSKKRKWIAGILAFLVIGALALLLTRQQSVEYESVTAQAGDITTYYSFLGNIEAKNRQTVMSEKAMQLSEILVEEGDLVEEGEVLIKSSTGDEITADISGEVVNLNIEENAQVMSGMKLLDIVDYDNLQVEVKVDEYDLSAIETGKAATVTVGAVEKEITGTISSLSKEGQVLNGVTYFTATVDLEPDIDLRVGMSAEVKLINSQSTGAVTLPMSVILFDDNNNPYVMLTDETGNGVKTMITVGINDGITAEITSGLSAGDSVYDLSTEETSSGFGFGFRRMSRANGGE